jgi:hypothetical protein
MIKINPNKREIGKCLYLLGLKDLRDIEKISINAYLKSLVGDYNEIKEI